eukprot:CAMPEP_0197696740 /NCGR_PEP_ID=MMETSP1338-20131121/117035_1 /TAXON_ID=43686 ORGANISM="Pelagodinium beii, Strain RCC1491" /NCGR_SAMPLE_ID=MMETSP1338 /ASSEMBLY_ACC=CAM_ASM_000754 /LENGTH=37 /DNA_ID= /DNA_START= /DNA_END= /DNA_ORIENTATION=
MVSTCESSAKFCVATITVLSLLPFFTQLASARLARSG